MSTKKGTGASAAPPKQKESKDVVQAIEEVRDDKNFSKRASVVLGIIIVARILVVLVITPIQNMTWNRKNKFEVSSRKINTEQYGENLINRAIKTFDVFDNTQFKNVIDQHGYQWETNHAFMPVFPYVIHNISKLTGFDTNHVGQVYQVFF